jgi:hypothetical protein
MHTRKHSHRRRKKKSKKGLNGLEARKLITKPSGIGLELSKPLLIVGGLLAGNLIGKGIDKVIAIPEDATGFQIKALVKPLVQAGLGVGVILIAKDQGKDTGSKKTMKTLIRNLGYGITGTGVISGIKIFKKDLFDGLGNDEILGDVPVEAKYYREAKDDIMQMLQDNSFRPALPEGNTAGFGAAYDDSLLGLNLSNAYDDDVSGLGIEDAEII